MAVQKYWDGLAWQVVGTLAAKVDIEDSGSLFTATNTEEALAEIKTELLSHTAENASDTTKGHVELATTAETTTGTDTIRAVTPAGVKAVSDAHALDYVRQPGYGVTTGTNTYVLTLSPVLTEYVDGVCVALKIGTTNTGASTLNVNAKGAKSLVKADGSAFASGELVAGRIYTFRYNSTSFILQGEGGGSNVKSIQRGVASFPSGNYSVDVTIASVDLSVAIVTMSQKAINDGLRSMKLSAQILNATTIRFTRLLTTAVGAFDFAWEVTEYNNVKSLQKGIIETMASLLQNVNVSSIDVSKSILFATWCTNATTNNYLASSMLYRISGSSTITFDSSNTQHSNVSWQLLEFK